MIKKISHWIENKRGTGEITIILILMVLGLFFLTKFVFKIPFPFIEKESTQETVSTTNQNNKEEK